MSINIENKESQDIESQESVVAAGGNDGDAILAVQTEEQAEIAIENKQESKVKKTKVKKIKVKMPGEKDTAVEKALAFVKKTDGQFEDIAFSGIAGRIKIISKILLYIFIALGLFGVILTALLTSSLGAGGVLIALMMVAVFVFFGYAISALLYGYGFVVENSAKPRVDFDQIIMGEASTHKKAEEKTDIDNEFPEF